MGKVLVILAVVKILANQIYVCLMKSLEIYSNKY